MNGEGWIGGEYNLRVEAGCFFFLTAGCLTTRVYTARSNGVCVYVCVLGGGGGSYSTGLPKFSHLSVLHAFTSGAYACTVCACVCAKNLVWFWIDLTTVAPCFIVNSKVFRTEMNLKCHCKINLKNSCIIWGNPKFLF